MLIAKTCGEGVICSHKKPMKNSKGIFVSNPSRTGSASAIIEMIKAEFDAAMGSPERVRSACLELGKCLQTPPTTSDLGHLQQLLPLLSKRMGPLAVPLFELFDQMSLTAADPWPLLEGMLAAKEEKWVRRALNRASDLAASGVLFVDLRIAAFLAEQVEARSSPFRTRECLSMVAKIINRLSLPMAPAYPSPIESLYLQKEDHMLRRLAARLMDLKGELVSHDLVEEVIGEEAHRFLAPYLDYTRPTHLDLLALVSFPGEQPPCLLFLKKAEAFCGRRLLQEVIAELGWPNVNFGLEVHRSISIRIGSSFPITMMPAEALFFETVKDASRIGESFVFMAHGGRYGHGPEGASCDDPVARFRSYNLAHSYVLADMISGAPLTREQIRRIMDWMDRIVYDFIALFSAHTEECSILPDIYQALRKRIVSELEGQDTEAHLSIDLIRLVQTFEDPKSLGEVRTLHGLKRYLHQRGLRLGFRLVDIGRATDRTIGLAVCSSKRVLRVSRCIRYTDFDQRDDGADLTEIPYPVRVVADGYIRQILHGQERLPETKVFCFGNEVHYYLSFKNHPVFVRIDFSPPLQGGMIDLQYYGVSKYEVDSHPNLSLDAIQEFFRQMEYDVKVKETHVHCRYDKERTVNLGVLCEKAETLFRLATYFMDIDWVIGSLSLSPEARRKVTQAWARFFLLWGVLPLGQLLTRDRQGILMGIERGPAGDREISWSGEGPYCDRFTEPLPPGLITGIRASLSEMGIEAVQHLDRYGGQELGQISIETFFLNPLRRAVAAGQVVETAEGLDRAPPGLFRQEHEAERFAEILVSDEETVRSSAALARIISSLEQTLDFRTTGTLNGYDVQAAPLSACGEIFHIYVLRDSGGIIRLSLFTRGDLLCLRRDSPAAAWQSNGRVDGPELAGWLRANNYPGLDMASLPRGDSEDAKTIHALFGRENPMPRPSPYPGERVVEGQKASPGRAVGLVVLGTEGRSAEDVDGKILVSPCIRPEDTPFFHHAAGIISTGGGILSHAGLIAAQLRKPALIVPGHWQQRPDGRAALLCRAFEYREIKKDLSGLHLTIRLGLHEQEYLLCEGDLAVLDSEEGILRILGQDPDALSFHEDFRQLWKASSLLAVTKDEGSILVLRGRRLKALHQMEKYLGRITDPILARHEAHELLMSPSLSSIGGGQSEKARLLSILLKNPAVSAASQDYLLGLFNDMRLHHNRLFEQGFHLIQFSKNLYEILFLRLQILRIRQAVEGVLASLRDCGFHAVSMDASVSIDMDRPVRRRLEGLRDALVQEVCTAAASAVPTDFRLRHLVRQIDRLDQVLETAPELRISIERLSDEIFRLEKSLRDRLKSRRTLLSHDGGLDLFPFIGWKAANLAESERILGQDMVPPWFAVTNRSFQEVMDLYLKRPAEHPDQGGPAQSPRTAIRKILSRHDLAPARKSQLIRQMWEEITLPPDLIHEVLTAYGKMDKQVPDSALRTEDLSEAFVAIRSSAMEEDTELAARAGEFDTFLFIRGERQVLDHLKRAWSGLWTERAIHNRMILGTSIEAPGGGIMIQRIARGRVSGVLQTANVSEGNFREMVINAGWGLGEGIVSGTVGADLIFVAKEGVARDRPLRFRYITCDKQEQVVFDGRTGQGTVRTRTLFHQRLRPALEYIEIHDLVRTAEMLEAAYGYPLDIEYCFEGDRLRILQVRPIATFLAVLEETLNRYPLKK